jgi:large subunit ribosomal protein L23
MALFGSKKNKETKEQKDSLSPRTPSFSARNAAPSPLSPARSARIGDSRSARSDETRSSSRFIASRAPKVSPKENPSAPSVPVIHRGQHHDIIIRPRITEKSGIASDPADGQAAVYTFEVRKNANKPMIAQVIKALYKVTPMKVRIVNLPAKRVFVRGKRGTSNAVKKAMVYLKKGEKINLT